jgi:hypothetical protein
MVAGLQPLTAKTWYVNSATTTWQGKPADDVKATIAEAIAAATDNDQVWVAAGVGEALTAVITLKNKVSLYGGFAGTENAIEDRAMVAGGQPWEFQNPTVLKSSVGVFAKPGGHTDAALTIIDGFTTEGYVNAVATAGGYAINYNATGAGGITVRNCIVQNTCQNYTGTADHGGVGVKGNTCVVEYCLIQNNKGKNGGGAYVEDGTIRSCVVRNNRTRLEGASSAGNATNAGNGGGVFILGAGKVYSCWIEGNEASYGGGAFMGNNANGLFYNNVVVNNTASKNGGAISYDERSNASVGSFPYNVTLANNRVTAEGGGGVYMGVSGNRLYNAILYNNKDGNGAVKNIAIATDKTPVLKSNISDADLSAYGAGNLIVADSAALFGGKWLTAATSPGKDAGTVEGITPPATDITGDLRVAGAAVDIGPYEVQDKEVVLTFGANVTVTAPSTATASPHTSRVTFNGEYAVTFTAPSTYKPVVKVNGAATEPVLSGDAYTVTVRNIAAATAIDISLIEPVEVTVTAGSGVVITYPSNTTSFFSDKGAPFELRFTAAGYDLTRVTVNGSEISLPVANLSGVYAIQLPSVSVATAIAIEAQKKTYPVAISAANSGEGGEVRHVGASSGFLGDSVTVAATANPRYEFTAWKEGGNVKSTDSVYTFTIGGEHALVADFRRLSSEAELLTLKVNGVFRQPEEVGGSSYKVYLNNNTAAVVLVAATVSAAATAGSEDLGERALTSDSTVLTITVTAEDRIEATTYTLTVIRPGGGLTAVEAARTGTLHVYPNPTSGIVYVETADGRENTPVKIYSLSGTLLQQATSSRVDLSGYPQGVYVLQAGNKAAKITKQ